MINIFDNYNQESLDLHTSLKKSEINNKTIVLNYNGFLPDDVDSPYSYFINTGKEEDNPLYFNRLEIPEFLEIFANNSRAVIKEFEKEVAKINYIEPKHKRLVHYVEWLDSNGKLRCIDHYDKYGYCYAKTIYNLLGELVNTSYFDKNNKEVIVENHVTGDIILNNGDKLEIFNSKQDFIKYYMQIAKMDNENILFNTLSTSFFVSLNNSNKGNDILVWQEKIGDAIPGNMQFILDNDLRTKKILVTEREVYNKILELVPTEKHHYFEKIGYVYDFVRENKQQKNVLILTNSDNIEHVEEIIKNNPSAWFHIAAVTEMSSKLMSLLNKVPNITLHQNVSMQKVDELFEICDYYLDINHEAEILNAVRRAFDNNMLIFAFNNTLHNSNFVAKENIFAVDDVQILIEKLNKVVGNKEETELLLNLQRNYANSVDNINVVNYER